MDGMAKRVHVVDKMPSRRAKIAFEFAQRNYSTQIYENVEELLAWGPTEGLLLMNEATAGDAINKVIRSVTSAGSYLPIAMYSEKPSTVLIVKAMLAGAIDYLEWPFDENRLHEAVKRMNEQALIRRRAIQKKAQAESALAELSSREMQVLKGVVQGLGNKEIAREMEISPRTVEVHRANMLDKLNARSTPEAVRIGIYGGLDEEA